MKIEAKNFADENERVKFLGEKLAGLFTGEVKAAALKGGRTAALAHLRGFNPRGYGKSRNFLNANISKLSAYLRHGLLQMTEVRDYFRETFANEPQVVEELLRQLAWRDFFYKALEFYGRRMLDGVEEAKHKVSRRDELPEDIKAGKTGLPCVDGMLAELFETGYLHNHERLWFAAYFCHFRGLDWRQGAKLFHQYLLDSDTASNNASWQWVESTFAAKPYFMNKENIAHYSNNRWCADCRVKCPFNFTYDELQYILFERGEAPLK
jgi:deoxyribodipyrimidine photo-lyase